ncbi:MAG: fibronectin type III domain-containing protein [Armatimonadota bacterium]
MRFGLTVLVVGLIVAAVCSACWAQPTVAVAFYRDGHLYIVQRAVAGAPSPELAAALLLQGPTSEEFAMGIVSTIPPGTRLIWAFVDGEYKLHVDLTSAYLDYGTDDAQLEAMARQWFATLAQFDYIAGVVTTIEGAPLTDFIKPAAVKERAPGAELPRPILGGVYGKKIAISPGHGRFWNGSGWYYMRPQSCGYEEEDLRNLKMSIYLRRYLENHGAIVYMARQNDLNYGNSPYDGGRPWWQMAASYWLKQAGYPCSVYASATGDCVLGSGDSESSDDIRARPLMSDYENTDIYVSIHTNAYQGYCVGTGCPTGTETYYDASSEHAPWATVSQQLGNAINPAIVNAINAALPEISPDWGCHGTCVKDSNGAYGEIRIPDRAATLTELGFHDTCDRDAPLLNDPFFRSVAMWGMYKGICDYFGDTASPMYNAQYVSDTIPATMTAGRTVSVSVTMRNLGVVWQEARGFRLGAVGDSDPFAATRHSVSGTIDPNTNYTFTFNMTAPLTPGDYTTDWRMVRDGFTWFGDTLTKVVHVEPPTDTEPPSTPQNLVAVPSGTTFVDLSWDPSTDNEVVTGYNVYRNGVKVKFVSAPSTTYRDTGLAPGTAYSYQVSAMDASSNESGLSNVANVTTLLDNTPPAAPTNVSAVGVSVSAIYVTWNVPWDNLTIVKYRVFRDGSEIAQPTTNSYLDTGLAAGSSHTYQITAIDQSDNESSKSAAATGRTYMLGDTVLWSDDMESHTSQASFESVWPLNGTASLVWSSAQSFSPTHSAEDDNTARRNVHDLTPAQSQVSVGTFFEFKFRDPAGATNVRHYAEIRSYDGGGHSGNLTQLLAIGAYNAGVDTSKYSGRVAFGGDNWFTLNYNRSAGWHTMRIDVIGDTSNPIAPGKGLLRFSVDGTTAAENRAFSWQPFTCLILGSNLASTTAGNYNYDDIKYGVQGTVQRIGGPDVVESPCGTVTITWKTDVDSDSRVDYGLTSAYGQSAYSGTLTKNHSITLTGLNTASTYHFRVVSGVSGKTSHVSGDYTFNTNAASLVQLKGQPDGKISGACGLVVSAVLPDGFYVQDADRICGLKVLGTQNASVGNIVSVTGKMATVGGERILQDAIVTVTGSQTAPAPRGMAIRTVGGAAIPPNIPGLTDGVGANNIGLLIRTWGRVIEVGSSEFWIDDGSALSAAGGKTGLKVAAAGLALPDLNDFVAITGISGTESSGGVIYPVLRPRTDSDIVKVAE